MAAFPAIVTSIRVCKTCWGFVYRRWHTTVIRPPAHVDRNDGDADEVSAYDGLHRLHEAVKASVGEYVRDMLW